MHKGNFLVFFRVKNMRKMAKKYRDKDDVKEELNLTDKQLT